MSGFAAKKRSMATTSIWAYGTINPSLVTLYSVRERNGVLSDALWPKNWIVL